jgi:phosphohistidine phosphatase SixA
MKALKSFIKNCRFLGFIFFFISCEQENTPGNLITSNDFVEDVLFVAYNSNGVNIKIETNTPAKFYPSTGRKTFPIEESGLASLVLEQGVYFIDVVWENGTLLKETFPVYINPNKDEAKKTVSALKGMKTNFSGYVLIFRHVDATVGFDTFDSLIPQWWKSCDPKVARQLNEVGKLNAKKIGENIKKLNIPIAGALSSEFCRAEQTIENMELGLQIGIDSRLNHGIESNIPKNWNTVFAAIKDNPKSNGVLLVVGHSSINYGNPNNSSIKPFMQSDGLLIKMNSSGNSEFIGSIPMFMWDLF